MHGFEAFVKDRRADLRRIAHATQGEMEADDLAQEAYLIAIELAAEMESGFDFSHPAHQDRLFACLYTRFVKYAEKTVRYAVKLDRGWDAPDDEAAGCGLSRWLAGPESDDPLARRLAEDHARGQAEALLGEVRGSYSQAAAYMLLLERVEWDVGALADLLWVGRDTARRRLARAAAVITMQPSCFDGIEAIPEDFQPWRRRWFAGRRREIPEGQGMLWQSVAHDCAEDGTPAQASSS